MSGTQGAAGLTTAETAELLGVKRQTVYAYVSRGILHRQVALDGRTSLFDRAEVEELRVGRRSDQDGLMQSMLTTGITNVSDERLSVRGHDLADLVGAGAGFTEVADLLWESPADDRWPPAPTEPVSIPDDMTLIDQLRMLVAAASSRDPMRHDLSPRSVRAAGRQAIVTMAAGLRSVTDGPPLSPLSSADGSLRFDATLWSGLGATNPTSAKRRAVDVALALLCDHGLASSTFAARIAASVRADPYSVITAGLGALGGPLHGAASSAVHELYEEAERRGDAATVVGDIQRRGGTVPGFGHTVYRSQDARYGVLMPEIVDAWGGDPRLQTVFRVRDVVGERSDIFPNIDLALGALTYLSGMPATAGEAMFAIARTAGWTAHAMEEYEEKPLRFRVKARYIGPRTDAGTDR